MSVYCLFCYSCNYKFSEFFFFISTLKSFETKSLSSNCLLHSFFVCRRKKSISQTEITTVVGATTFSMMTKTPSIKAIRHTHHNISKKTFTVILRVIKLCVAMLSVIRLRFVMLSIVKLSVVRLNSLR